MINTATKEITEYILSNFEYDDGYIIRHDRRNSNGSKDKDGYLTLKIKGKRFKAHRIIWLLVYREWPESELDHINRDRTDNRIENLRLANREIQFSNMCIKPNKDTGVVGIHIDKTKGLKAKFVVSKNNKKYRFRTLEKAIEFKEEIKNGSLSKTS